MFKNLINFTYPFISLAVIEVGSIFNTIVETGNSILSFLIFLLQLIIAVLTIIKIYSDIKKKKFTSIDKSEKSTEKKHKFLFALFTYLKTKI